MPRRLRFLSADSDYAGARVVIIGVPLERTVSFRGGTAQAPTAIRHASDSIESFSAIFRRELGELGVCDLGDLPVEAPLEEVLGALRREVGRAVSAGKRAVVLGGEHTVTLGAVRGALEALGGLQLLALDAHTDLRDEYRGERVCHATVLRRCYELLGGLVIVGARSFFGGEPEGPAFAPPEEAPGRLDPEVPLWLSIDLDALDPSLCPGVTNPEPGGLSYGQVIELFRALRGFRVVGMDLVELAPPFDPTGVSSVTAAKLLLEGMIALFG